MSSEHPWRGNQQEMRHAALAPRGEVTAGGVPLAAPTKVRVGAVGMDEGERTHWTRNSLKAKVVSLISVSVSGEMLHKYL